MFLAAETWPGRFCNSARVPSKYAPASLSACSAMPCVSQYVGVFLTRPRQTPLESMVLLLSSFLFAYRSRYFCFGRFFPLQCDRVCCHETMAKLHRMRRPLFSISSSFNMRIVAIACNDDGHAFSVKNFRSWSISVPPVDITVLDAANRRFHRMQPQILLHEPHDLASHVFDFPEWYQCCLVLLVPHTIVLVLFS